MSICKNSGSLSSGKYRVVMIGFPVLLILLFSLLIFFRGISSPEIVTTECPFCRLYAGDGLALIDTQTGDTDLIDTWLFDLEHPEEPGSWESQFRSGNHSTFSFMTVCGGAASSYLGGTRLTFKPQEVNTSAYFCEKHRSLAIAPYVLVDRENQEAFEVYPIYPGEEFHFRHYTVLVDKEEDSYIISIESSLFEEEVAQWWADQRRPPTG